jgi:peptidyl-prolyl cis-trans isomerase SurA
MKFFKNLTLFILLCHRVFANLDAPPSYQNAIISATESENPPSLLKAPQNVTLYKKDRQPSTTAAIAAIVNGTPISVKDLKNKLKLVLKVPLERLSPAERDQITLQVLNILIDELLKIQTTEKFGLKVDQKDIEATIQHIEKQNNLPKNGFRKMLKERGIPESTLINSIKADLLWRQYISAWAGNTLEVDKKELKEIMNPSSIENTQYHLAEISIYTAEGESDEKSLEKINHALAGLKAKKSFMMLAHTYSHAPSAARGGDIGWITQDMLDSDTLEIIQQLQPGQLTPPIKIEHGYKVLLLIDKKDNDGLQSTLTARQIEIKVDEETAQNQKKLTEKMDQLNKLVQTISTCAEFDQLSDQIPASQIHVYKMVRLNELSTDLQMVLKDLETGVPSKGIFNNANNTIVFFLICERNETSSEKAHSIEGIATQISNQRFMSISEQKLKEAKRVASIEIRI